MFNSDVVFGWISSSGQTTLGTWNIPQDYYWLSDSTAVVPPWTTMQGIVQAKRPSDGQTVTTICFARPLNAPTAEVSAKISVDSVVNLLYAVQSDADGGPSFGSPHTYRGVYSINLATGSATPVAISSRLNAVVVHGALMAVAWVLLFPLGVLLARHKFLFENRKLGSKDLWFYVHMGLQVVGLCFFIAGSAYAFLFLDTGTLGKTPTPATTLSSCTAAHQVYGVVLMGMTGVQILLGFVRPNPGPSMLRKVWEFAHKNLGRLSIISGWSVTLLGVYVGNKSTAYNLSYNQWLWPVILVISNFVVVDLVLSFVHHIIQKEKMAAGPTRVVCSSSAAPPAESALRLGPSYSLQHQENQVNQLYSLNAHSSSIAFSQLGKIDRSQTFGSFKV